MGKVVKDTEEEKGKEDKDGLRNRFLGLQLRPRDYQGPRLYRLIILNVKVYILAF